jgi:hypothetical protein
MATSESASEAIIRRYAAAMNLGPAHTVLFLAASVGVTCVFLAPLMTGFGPLPPWLFWVAFPPVVLWLLAALPKHFLVLSVEPDLQPLLNRPILALQCLLAALWPRPPSSLRPWLLWPSIVGPVVAALVTLVVGLARSFGRA